MKIMKVSDKKVGETEYYKYRITLPKEVVEKSKFIGKSLNAVFTDGKIIIKTE